MSTSGITKKALGEALRALCKTKSFEKITVADIAGACNITRQSFYYHFQDKYDLLYWVYGDDLSMPHENEKQSTAGCDFLEQLKTIYAHKQFYMDTVQLTGYNYGFSYYYQKLTERMYLQAMEPLLKRNDIDPSVPYLYAQFFSYGFAGIVAKWICGGMKVTPQVLERQMMEMPACGELLESAQEKQ